VKAGGEGAGLAEGAGRIDLEDGQLAFAVVVGLLARFNEAGSLGLLDFQAVLDDGDARWRPAESGVARCLIEAHDFRAGDEPLIALFGDEFEGFLQREPGRERQSEGDANLRLRGCAGRVHQLPNDLWGLAPDRLGTLTA